MGTHMHICVYLDRYIYTQEPVSYCVYVMFIVINYSFFNSLMIIVSNET
jgi:hypothetical protein